MKSLRKRSLGHHLMKCLEQAKCRELLDVVTVTSQQIEELKKADFYYPKKGFEYFQVGNAVRGYKDLPNLEALQQLAQQLLTGTEETCRNAV